MMAMDELHSMCAAFDAYILSHGIGEWNRLLRLRTI